ncbi:hypothetical protein EYF80_022246 [Liparis tanakae]|uniref:Uncharacterized protein n=1 Tax=Liparis tanakae TaxID=230148 RepID=A0A4Z2HRD8_9TELE|nr:hypothetical protein EYF80_022246 [Liparis tanakae]
MFHGKRQEIIETDHRSPRESSFNMQWRRCPDMLARLHSPNSSPAKLPPQVSLITRQTSQMKRREEDEVIKVKTGEAITTTMQKFKELCSSRSSFSSWAFSPSAARLLSCSSRFKLSSWLMDLAISVWLFLSLAAVSDSARRRSLASSICQPKQASGREDYSDEKLNQQSLRTRLADLLLTAVVGEAHEGELVAHKGLRYGEGLLLSPVLLDVVEVAGVDVTAQLGHDWGGRCTGEEKMEDS